MAKYIKADDLIEDLRYDIELDARTLDDLDFADAKGRELVQLDKDIKQNTISILEQTPTADVVEVVRCKDCKHSVKQHLGYGCEMNFRLGTNGNWFCADGERSEDGEIH